MRKLVETRKKNNSIYDIGTRFSIKCIKLLKFKITLATFTCYVLH